MYNILASDAVSKRIFYPRKTDVEPTMMVETGDGHTACYFAQPDPDAGTILHFHGNGEVAADYWMHLRPLFLSSGLNVCFVDYRGYGFSDGAPNLIRQLDDNVELVNRLGINLDQLIVYGRSLGSLFACDLVARLPQIAGLVLESGIANLLEDWPLLSETRELGKTEAELNAEVATAFDNRQKLAAYAGELLVFHTANDSDLGPDHAVRLHSWCSGRNKRLVIFDEGDHSSILAVNAAAIGRELSDMGDRLEIKT